MSRIRIIGYQYACRTDYLVYMKPFVCMYQKDIYKPYEKCHSTVKDAAELGSRLKVKNLLLWHTEEIISGEENLSYEERGKKYFKGTILYHMMGKI